jgi:hypothetical protein
MADYGVRPNGQKKGTGWMGELKRPDGSVSTELSVSFSDILGGNPIPLIVPTLTPEEVNILLSLPEGQKAPEAIIRKAIDHARERDKQGLSPFAN